MAGAYQEIELNDFQANAGRAGHAVDVSRIDHTPLFRVCSVYLGSRVKESIDRSTSPDGTPFKPLKRPRRRARDRRAKGGAGQKPLRDTGLMQASAEGRGRGAVKVFGRLTFEQGSSLDRARWHQYGTKTIPARPFVGVNARDADKLATFAADFYEKKVADDVVRRLAGGG